MQAWILTFISVFAINIAYTYYLKAVQNNKAFVASSWAAAINLVASVVAIGYIEDHKLIIPSCLGSFLGTIVGMYLGKRDVA